MTLKETKSSLDDYSNVTSNEEAWQAVLPPETLTLINVKALIEALPLLKNEFKEPATSYDILRIWTKHKNLDSLLPKSAFVEVPWSEVQKDKTTYGVMTYYWGDATWADMVPLLEKYSA